MTGQARSRMYRATTLFPSERRHRLFTAVKYLTYALLCVNVLLFLRQELTALEHTFTHGVRPAQLIQVFSATIDTAAWILLLLLFELETSVLDDRRLRGSLKYWLAGIRALCYVAVVYAFSGYCAELLSLYRVAPLAGEPCSLAGQGWSLLVGLDEYLPLDGGNCAALGAAPWRLDGFDIVATGPALQDAQVLAWVDVINAGAWILVVLLLEAEVWLQLRHELSAHFMHVAKFFKFAVYLTLFAAAAYWGYAGAFLDFWDAALWLFAFIFIEMNVFEWQQETVATR